MPDQAPELPNPAPAHAGFPQSLLISRQALAAMAAFGILVLSGIMAVISGYNAHPDERYHVPVGEYYMKWWIPPAVDDPRVEPSISQYGGSYHDELDVAYMFAGKFAALLGNVVSKPHIALRLFNVCLFGLLVLIAATMKRKAPLFLLLFLPAQAWYVFSYFNSDAFPLFLSLLCAWLLATPGSPVLRFFESPGFRRGWGGALLLAALLGTVFLCKRNYRLFLLFVGFYGFLMATRGNGLKGWATLCLKWAAIAVLALAFAYPRIAIDHWVNSQPPTWTAPEEPATDGESGQAAPDAASLKSSDDYRYTKWYRMKQRLERAAIPELKPSVRGTGETTFIWAQLRDRGIPFTELFTKMDWHTKVYQSTFGLYGWMEFPSSDAYYLLVGLLYLGVAGFAGWRIVRLGGWRERALLAVSLAFCLLMVWISADYSWRSDYQPQGRYIFPCIGILTLLMVYCRDRFPRDFLLLAGLLLSAVSASSFIFTGLAGM